jgi:hypothetical protein
MSWNLILKAHLLQKWFVLLAFFIDAFFTIQFRKNPCCHKFLSFFLFALCIAVGGKIRLCLILIFGEVVEIGQDDRFILFVNSY